MVCEISIIILICQKLGSVGPVQQKNKLLLPYATLLNNNKLNNEILGKLFNNEIIGNDNNW